MFGNANWYNLVFVAIEILHYSFGRGKRDFMLARTTTVYQSNAQFFLCHSAFPSFWFILVGTGLVPARTVPRTGASPVPTIGVPMIGVPMIGVPTIGVPMIGVPTIGVPMI